MKNEVLANIINFSIAVFTFLMVVVACFQLNMFRRQLASMDKALAHSAEASAAAQASADAARIANDVNKASQRPWIVVQQIIPKSPFSVNDGLSFSFLIRNVGNSPAANVELSSVMHLPHRGDAHQIHRELGREQLKNRKNLELHDNIKFGYLIAPGESLEIKVGMYNQLFDYQQAAAIHPFGELIILIVGQISYSSGIEQNWHESGFIFSVSKKESGAITLRDNLIAKEDVEIKRFPAGFYAT